MSDLIPEDLPHADEMDKGVLGRTVDNLPSNPAEFEIDVVPNPVQNKAYFARFTVPEFTSLCPKTSQPDFATIYIDYIPRDHLIESKALKLFMYSFRSHGAFHEECVNTIARRLWDAAKPQWLRVVGIFNPRGGIPIDVMTHAGVLPDHIREYQVPPMPMPQYDKPR